MNSFPPTCHPRSFVHPPPLYTSRPLSSQSRRVELVIAPTQGATWLLHHDDADTQLAAGVHARGFTVHHAFQRQHNRSNASMIKRRSLPTRLDKPCCSSSCWSATPTWSSTTFPWSAHKYISLIPLLISNQPILTLSYANISKQYRFLNKCSDLFVLL